MLRDPGSYAVAACTVATVAYWLAALAGLIPADVRGPLGDAVLVLLGAVAVALCGRQVLRQTHPAARRAWTLLTVGYALYLVADTAWLAHTLMHDGEVPFLTWIDGVYLAYYPLVLAGLLSLPAAPRRQAERVKFALDLTTVVLAGGLVLWFTVIRPLTLESYSRPLEAAITLAYPSMGLLLLTGATVVLLRPQRALGRVTLALLAAATLVDLAADLGYGIASLKSEYQGGDWPDLLWMVARLCVMTAAYWPIVAERRAVVTESTGVRIRHARALPYVALVASYGLAIWLAVRHWSPVLSEALLGTFLLTMIVVLRQALTERGARRAELRFGSLVRHSSDVTVVLGHLFDIRYASPAAERLFGIDTRALQGRRAADLVHPDDLEAARAQLRQAAAHPGTPVTIACRVRRTDDTWCDTESVVTNLLDDPTVGGLVLNMRDVSERTALEAQLTHQAFHDPLTNLSNRARFQQQVARALARAADRPDTVCVLFLDLDDFKRINDSLGHAAGDRLLCTVAERLLNATRGADTVARLGGDEFAVLIENVRGEEDAATVADRILRSMRASVELEGGQVLVGSSIGIARATADDTVDTLLRNADVAMYIAKHGGKGRFEFFRPEMHASALERLELEADLRRAVAEQQLSLVFQPIVRVGTREITGVEALARWDHPTRGPVSPAVFIPIAEATGIILPLGAWVLREACRQASLWPTNDEGYAPTLSVNISGRQLRDAELVSMVAASLVASGMSADRLVLEVTESVALQGSEETVERLQALRALGIRIAVDDFGTGYSSFAYLQHFPVDMLKIDRSFIAASDSNEPNSLLRAIVAMADELGLAAVAEGIEGDAADAELRRIGCTLAQGYLYGRPMPGPGMQALLHKRRTGELAAAS